MKPLLTCSCGMVLVKIEAGTLSAAPGWTADAFEVYGACPRCKQTYALAWPDIRKALYADLPARQDPVKARADTD